MNTAEGMERTQDSIKSPIALMQHSSSPRGKQRLSPRAVRRPRKRSDHLRLESIWPKQDPFTLMIILIWQTYPSSQFVLALVASS